jgi:hypothetical protein
MAALSDDELCEKFREATKQPQSHEDFAARASISRAIQLIERDYPEFREHDVVAERLINIFNSRVGEVSQSDRNESAEMIAKLVLLFDKPLLAVDIVRNMLDNLDDPKAALQSILRMAEVAMNAKFTVETVH